jgi:DnaJ-class molecular chaperone
METPIALLADAVFSTKAACERLAMTTCRTCLGRGGHPVYVPERDRMEEASCPDCDGTGDAFKTWQDACRSLGDGAGREGKNS